ANGTGALPSPDLQQLQRIEAHIAAVQQAVERLLADVRETVEQLAAGQDQMVREINQVLAADDEILNRFVSVKTPQTIAELVVKSFMVNSRYCCALSYERLPIVFIPGSRAMRRDGRSLRTVRVDGEEI